MWDETALRNVLICKAPQQCFLIAAWVVVAYEHGVELDRTVFYPLSGGQPGDRGDLDLSLQRSDLFNLGSERVADLLGICCGRAPFSVTS